ncbi:putative cytochrome p450 [Lyophyllum shimeji]|uniref:Cytochrome p450 n=1 Tax=Lyophyllum shimeji TaxID=47721 RepID=A0A9P3UML2_LYOSH|nr:putative cytochrome p450 [Lyophyllum shimeji]
MLDLDAIYEPRTIAGLVLATTLLGVVHRKLTHRSSTLPPGPPPDSWIFGNTLPNAFAYRRFEEWTKQYGPVFSLRQGLTTVIVIGRYDAAVEIMEREGAHLADRPLSISAGETLSGGMRVLLTPFGERFKKMRKALHAHLSPKVVQSYGPVLMRSAKQHILDILDNPDIHQEHAKRYSASVVMALAYGKSPGKHDDPDVVAVNRCLVRLGVTLRPGVWKVDVYPFLRYIPGYLDELKEGHKEELALFKKHLGVVKAQMARNDSLPPSFAAYLLERQSTLGLSDDETAYLAGALFGAGSDTTASAISVGVLAAACYPEAARRVQEELDRVVGRTRAPAWADVVEAGKTREGARGGAALLNELHAFVLETFRWRPVTAGGFAHKATKDVIWKDYVIPKGATVIGNVWSVGRDPAYFPNPETFDPQRWLREDGTLREDLKSYAFGFGRRVCPGQHIATASVLLNTALIQWAFSVHRDPAHPIDELAFTESANAHPVPFHVRFEPRAGLTREAVREMLEEYGEM